MIVEFGEGKNTCEIKKNNEQCGNDKKSFDDGQNKSSNDNESGRFFEEWIIVGVYFLKSDQSENCFKKKFSWESTEKLS